MPETSTEWIEIILNGERRRVPSGLNVTTLLAYLEIDPARVAVEIDRKIARKRDWGSSMIGDAAEIEVVQFVGGG